MNTIYFLYKDLLTKTIFIVAVENDTDAPAIADDIASEHFQNPVRCYRVSRQFADESKYFIY